MSTPGYVRHLKCLKTNVFRLKAIIAYIVYYERGNKVVTHTMAGLR